MDAHAAQLARRQAEVKSAQSNGESSAIAHPPALRRTSIVQPR